jgi:hypothetical protein
MSWGNASGRRNGILRNSKKINSKFQDYLGINSKKENPNSSIR